MPPIFAFLQKAGKIKDHEMMRTFNNGLGLVAIVRIGGGGLFVCVGCCWVGVGTSVGCLDVAVTPLPQDKPADGSAAPPDVLVELNEI